MDSEHGGLLKTRAEDFARHLHTRLHSLREDDNTWTSVDSNVKEVYYDIDSSLVSPQEELSEPIFISNKSETYPLERDSSSDSQYFDSSENLEDLSPVELKKTNLRTESKPIAITNSHRDLRDDDEECNILQQINISEIGNENNYEIDTLKETCSRMFNLDEELPFTTNGEVLLVDEDQENVDLSEEAEEETTLSQDSLCVYCDLEQIKSNLSNGYDKEEELVNDVCEDNENNVGDIPKALCSSMDESSLSSTIDKMSLTDLLRALKQDIVSDNVESGISNTCPNIQVHESSPTKELSQTEAEECDIEVRRKSFQRSSSLKSGKTPPGTPGRKKIVRFADVLGLDLADVKTFLDEVPTVPKSAYEDLQGIELSSSPLTESLLARFPTVSAIPQKSLIPLFQQPSVQPNFLDRVRNCNVCLESAFISDSAFSAISGFVRVKNIDFHKSVYVRYSIDRWKTYSDLQARYVPNSGDGFSDKFAFTLYAHTLNSGQRIEFAIRYIVAGAQYWDSNGGSNYIFECMNQLPPDPVLPASPMDTWAASFY